MKNLVLMKSQKNIILTIIKTFELDPFAFRWSEIVSARSPEIMVSRLDYAETGFYYIFDVVDHKDFSEFSPANDKLYESHFGGSWENQIKYFSSWLAYLKREIEEPDLWKDLAKYQLAFNPNYTDSENNTFTYHEVEQIMSGIDQMKQYLLSELQNTDEQVDFINEKIDYLTDTVKRQGRKDWIHTCIGVLFTIATALALSPDQTRQMWEHIKLVLTDALYLLTK